MTQKSQITFTTLLILKFKFKKFIFIPNNYLFLYKLCIQ